MRSSWMIRVEIWNTALVVLGLMLCVVTELHLVSAVSESVQTVESVCEPALKINRTIKQLSTLYSKQQRFIVSMANSYFCVELNSWCSESVGLIKSEYLCSVWFSSQPPCSLLINLKTIWTSLPVCGSDLLTVNKLHFGFKHFLLWVQPVQEAKNPDNLIRTTQCSYSFSE